MARSGSGSAEDPRDIVTDYAFRVSPELIGTPLALPWRRAVALSVDGALVALLANAPGVIFGVATAFVLLRAAKKPVTGGVIRRSVRRTTRFAAGLILFAVSVSLWNTIADRGAGPSRAGRVERPESALTLSGMPGLRTGADMVGLLRTSDQADARARLDRMVAEARRSGVPDHDLAEAITEVVGTGMGSTAFRVAADSVLVALSGSIATEENTAELREDSLLAAYAAALEEGDTASARAVRSQLSELLSRETVTGLRQDLQVAQRRNDVLSTRLEDLEGDRGIVAGFLSILEDLGLGLGWTGLYFTAFIVLWRGRTPGKRLMGLRVVRLDNLPIGWWNAFERFAGYAAGLATGLLGFLQIFWDRNRQAVQDKISRTVVVQE